MDPIPFNEMTWVEVLPLTQPEPWLSLPWIIGLSGVSVILLMLFWRYWRKRPLQQARRQLRQLYKYAKTTDPDTKMIVHGIAGCLRMATGANHLEHLQVSLSLLYEWNSYRLQLQEAQFSSIQPSLDDIQRWIRQTSRWFRHCKYHAQHP